MTTRRTFIRSAAACVAAAGIATVCAADEGEQKERTMLQRAIPSSGQAIPVIGMGTWQTFDPPRIDDASLQPLAEVMKIFFDAGGRVVDSSPMYGKSEEVTGLLASRLKINDELFIATKVWTQGQAAGVTQMEKSLQKLQRERIELMQVHNLVDWRTHLDTLRRWKDQGRARYVGVTHYQVSAFEQLETLIREQQLDFVQLPYSLALRDAEKRLLPAARDAGVAVLVNRPFEGGDLFRSVRDKPLHDSVREYADTWGQAFLKFLLANEAVTCVIPATSNPKHMRDNVQAGMGKFPDQAQRAQLIKLLF